MNLQAQTARRLAKPLLGGAVTVLCGVALWVLPLGERYINASYDLLFRFLPSRSATTNLVLILMDKDALKELRQERGHWDRRLHADLLRRLNKDGCRLVVFDSTFDKPRDPSADIEFAEALRKTPLVVLAADQAGATYLNSERVIPIPPIDLFMEAAKTNWGVAWFDPDLDFVVRRHWPFPAPEELFPSLPWAAAQLVGANLSAAPEKQWLRYYGKNGPWSELSYHLATNQSPNFFSNKIVFIGNKPETPAPDGEKDEFRTPYTRGNGEAVGGIELIATEFLNLVNHEWLLRPSKLVEALILILSGGALGAGLCRLRTAAACVLAATLAVSTLIAAVSLTHLTNYWFPWLIISVGEVPCALACCIVARRVRRGPPQTITVTFPVERPGAGSTPARLAATPILDLPDAPDYQIVHPPFGQGAYGKVWLVRSAIGQWQALKTVYLSKFHGRSDPYDREFNGIKRYKPISDKHPGLLRVDFVSTKKEAGYFYYVMELGDGTVPGWELEPAKYAPRDLARTIETSEGRRLPLRECLRIGIILAEALEFLHQHGLTHRDIKPQNIIFVNNTPKLADVGLVADILPEGKQNTLVGTPAYMPPPPEPAGTPQADVYGLGKVLYEIRTGMEPTLFPEVSTTLVAGTEADSFLPFNNVVLKACQPDRAQRYASAAELRAALMEVEKAIDLARV